MVRKRSAKTFANAGFVADAEASDAVATTAVYKLSDQNTDRKNSESSSSGLSIDVSQSPASSRETHCVELSSSSSSSSSASPISPSVASTDSVEVQETQITIEASAASDKCSSSSSDNKRSAGAQMSENLTHAAEPLTLHNSNKDVHGGVLELTNHASDFDEEVAKAAMFESRRQRDSFAIEWHKLDYVVESKWYKLSSQRKPILNALSGSFESGQLSAVLGPSGAGKSTLIDCLLGKRASGLSGRTRVSFSSREHELERRSSRPLRIALIPQEDHLLDSLTVAETFMFASRIKNANRSYESDDEDDDDDKKAEEAMKKKKKQSKKRRPFDHFANVQRVIQQLGLSQCASVKCGKLSGGQYKRVSIGQELLSRPDVMVLDEPTSGLDAITCFQTVNALRTLIDTSPYPMSIVATIHQPDVEVFNLFHKAYVLSLGGRAIFEGPPASIYGAVRAGLELVEARREQPTRIAGSGSTATQQAAAAAAANARCSDSMDALREQLDSRNAFSNPARLIVSVAANEFGHEIMSAMNELQIFKHQASIAVRDYISTSTNSQSPSSAVTALMVGCDDDARSSRAQTPCTSVSVTMEPTSGGDDDAATRQSMTRQRRLSTSVQSLIERSRALDKPPEFDYVAHDPARRAADLDKLLCLAGTQQLRTHWLTYWRHVVCHTQRSWLTIKRDPMLFTVQILLHIIVPLLISYCFQGRTSDACPKPGPLDVVHEAYRDGNILDELNGELRIAFENLGYIFFQIYVIIFAAVCVTSLTYPLVMHVLLKEYRNGWYSLSSYFIGRTIADLPVPTFNVFLAMAISYHLTGQPLSPYGWRYICVAGMTLMATLVAQTQGLMFGALLMNAAQAAVFVAPASTAPLVTVSGFLIRVQALPVPLQLLSKLSYFTYMLNGIIVARYGFKRCPCDERTSFGIDDSHHVPQQARALINMWIDTFADEQQLKMGANSSASDATQLQPADLVVKLVDTVSRAKTFGHEMSRCSQVKPFTMLDYQLDDSDLAYCFVALVIMLLVFRWITFAVLSWKIKSCV